jgi:hypothetical protein
MHLTGRHLAHDGVEEHIPESTFGAVVVEQSGMRSGIQGACNVTRVVACYDRHFTHICPIFPSSASHQPFGPYTMLYGVLPQGTARPSWVCSSKGDKTAGRLVSTSCLVQHLPAETSKHDTMKHPPSSIFRAIRKTVLTQLILKVPEACMAEWLTPSLPRSVFRTSLGWHCSSKPRPG